jgi:hypothetical protein
MPTGALHSHYWAGSADAPAAPQSTTVAYVPWQVNVIAGGGFGVLQVVWEWAVYQSQTAWPSRRT